MKWLRMTLITLAILTTLILALLSPWGTLFAIKLADSNVDELRIGDTSGSLLSTLELHQIQYSTPGLDVKINKLKAKLQWSCLFAAQVCLPELIVDELNVNLDPQASPEPDNDTAQTMIRLPAMVAVEKFAINRAVFSITQGPTVSWRTLQGRIAMQDQLTLSALDLYDPKIVLPKPTPTVTSAPFDVRQISQFEYSPLTLPTLFIPLDVEMVQLRVHNLVAQQQSETLSTINKIELAGTINNSNVQIAQLQIEHPQGTLKVAGELKSDYAHDLSVEAQVSLALFKQPLKVNGTLSGKLSALNWHIVTQGAVTSELQLNSDLTNRQLPLDLAVNWQKFAVNSAAKTLQLQAGEMTINGDLQGYQIIGSSSATLAGLPKMVFNLDALATQQRLDLRVLQVDTLEGVAKLAGQLQLSNRAQWQGILDLKNIQPGSFWSQLQGDINGRIINELSYDSTGLIAQVEDLSLNGTWLGYALNAQGSGSYSSETGLKVPSFSISNGDNMLSASATLSTEQVIDADINLNAADLSQLYPGLSGAAELQAFVEGLVQQPEVLFDASADHIQIQQLSLQQAKFNGELVWNEGKSIDVLLNLKNLSFSGEPIDSLKLRVAGDAKQHDITINMQSQSIQFKTALRGELTQGQWLANWLEGDFDSLWGDYQLDSPDTQILADWSGQNYQLTPHCWKDSNAALCVNQAEFKQQIVRFDVYGRQLELLQIISTYLPQIERLRTDSRLFFEASGEWNTSDDSLPRANLFARLTPAAIHLKKLPHPIALNQFEITATAGQSNIDASIELDTTELGNVEAKLLLRDWANSRELAGDLSIQGMKLDPLAPLIQDLDEFGGKISGQLQLKGNLQTPLLYGNLGIEDVILSGEILPVRIHDWDQRVAFDGQRAQLQGQFFLGDGKGTSSGFADWSDKPIGEIQLQGERFELDYRDTVRATFSPDVKLTVNADLIKFGGKLDVVKARIKVRELPADAYKPSDDVVIVNEKPKTQEQVTPIELALTVNIDPQRLNDVQLDAFGLRTSLRGSLDIAQIDNKVTGHGDLNLVNGRYQAYGQDLQIRKGEILFSGPMDRPVLDIEAIREPTKTADDVIVGLRVSGQAEAPEVSVFSNPVMEDSEALSYLLQGRSMNAPGESPDNAMLAAVLINAGISGSENRVNKLGQTIGIEDLSFDTTGSGDETQVSVSGYIAPGVQLRYGVGVFDSASQVALRYQLLPQLYLEAVNGANAALDIYYQFSLGKVQTNASDNQQQE